MAEHTSTNSTPFKVHSKFAPTGDQPKAIKNICDSFQQGDLHHTLVGVTGSGKTFAMAHVVAELNCPTLVIAPNKTLAAQLFTEFRELFPDNAVEFFISYYDYFQPEAYVPSSDTYIAKDSSINDDIDKMRHAATRSLFERKDVLIVASVSCIYGLGSPASYAKHLFEIETGQEITRKDVLRRLVDIQYTRNDTSLVRGSFRVRGDIIDILPSHQNNEAVRISMFGDEIETLETIDSLTGKTLRSVDKLSLYPNSHYVADRDDMKEIVHEVLVDLGKRLREYKALGKEIEYQRLEQRTMHDVELLEQLGFCPGIENYSRYLTGLPSGHPPPTLLNYFPDDFLVILDESHLTLPQLGGMSRGDQARKKTLVDYGFRLPSALDNRPLNFDEFLQISNRILFVSATPGDYELESSKEAISEQIIRPTGLLDPEITIRPVGSQVDDLYGEINKSTALGGRVLISTLTKKMAEDLTTYYEKLNIKVRYLHSGIDSLERVEILRDLRRGEFDVLIGINLLREGLDLPEVNLVAVMDADKEGFLRSRSALIQIVGRAARNADSRVLFYADKTTDSMRACLEETKRRRTIQIAYNKEHGITPQTIQKEIGTSIRELYGLSDPNEIAGGDHSSRPSTKSIADFGVKNTGELDKLIKRRTKAMQKAAAKLDFEKAAEIRDEVIEMKGLLIKFGEEP